MTTPTEKKCKKCEIVKPLEDFNKQKIGKFGRRSQCRECQKAESRRYLAENGEVVKKRQADRRARMANRDLSTLVLPDTLPCSACGENKPPTEFHNNKFMKLGKVTECKSCVSIRDRKFREENPEKIYQWDKNYRENNREHRNAWEREWRKHKRATDPTFRLKDCVRVSINSGLNRTEGSKQGQKTFDMLPYTPEELKEHIESQFEDWMTWDNWGIATHERKTWNIDHIIPQSLLPYESLEHENFHRCWALENLQPLETFENIKKSNNFKMDDKK